MSVDLTKPDLATPDPVPRPRRAAARLRRRSRSAVARSAAGDRWLVALIGLVLLLAGVGVALLSYGVFGTARAGRSLLDPIMVDTVAADPVLWRVIAIAGGIVLAVLGLAWVARSVRPEPRPDVVLDGGPDTTILVSSGAAADAVAAQAGTLAGVGRARAVQVGAVRGQGAGGLAQGHGPAADLGLADGLGAVGVGGQAAAGQPGQGGDGERAAGQVAVAVITGQQQGA